MKDEKEMQKKYVYSQILKQQATALIEEKQLIDARINEISITKEAMKRMGDMSKGDLMWSPIGSGAFMVSNAEDTENVLVSVGAGVLVKTKRGNAFDILDKRLKDMQDADNQVTAELNKFAQQIGSLDQELQEMIEAEQHRKELKEKPKKHGEKIKGTGG